MGILPAAQIINILMICFAATVFDTFIQKCTFFK